MLGPPTVINGRQSRRAHRMTHGTKYTLRSPSTYTRSKARPGDTPGYRSPHPKAEASATTDGYNPNLRWARFFTDDHPATTAMATVERPRPQPTRSIDE